MGAVSGCNHMLEDGDRPGLPYRCVKCGREFGEVEPGQLEPPGLDGELIPGHELLGNVLGELADLAGELSMMLADVATLSATYAGGAHRTALGEAGEDLAAAWQAVCRAYTAGRDIYLGRALIGAQNGAQGPPA